MKRIILFSITFILFSSFMSLNAQWLKDYGEGRLFSIQQTKDGGYIVAAEAGLLITDAILLKLDSAGDIEWKRIYGEGGDIYDVSASSVQQTNDGGYILAGREGAAFSGTSYLWVLKLDPAGDIEWQRVYGSEYASSIQETSDGGYIVAGDNYSFGVSSSSDIWILKLSSNGDIEWQRSYGGNGGDTVSSIQETSDGGYIVAGDNYSIGDFGSFDIWILKLSSNGDIEWQRSYGGNEGDSASSIRQTSDGGYIVAGDTSSFGVEGADIWILKLSSNGDIEWQRAYGRSYSDSASSIRQTSDGGYIVAGQTVALKSDKKNGWFFKLDSAGDIEWQSTFGDNGDSSFNSSVASSIQEISDGGYIVGGSISVTSGGGFDWMSYNYIRILKLLSDGDIHTYCEYVSRSNATITDTDISPDFSYLSYQDTNVTPLDTDIPATLVHTTADTLCPESTLDDENDNPGKKCFIATAAYGSSIHPYVKTLRDFRDKYLMPHKLGRKLVDLYYRYSPFVANIIAKRNALKIAVQIHLLPLVVFCYSMVHFGPIITGGIALFILVLPVFFMTTLRKERG